jgi:hypothetical protein
VAHTVPFMPRGEGRLSGMGVVRQMAAQGFFASGPRIMGDTWRTNRMILDLDSRFHGGSVLELDDRITEGSKT